MLLMDLSTLLSCDWRENEPGRIQSHRFSNKPLIGVISCVKNIWGLSDQRGSKEEDPHEAIGSSSTLL